MKSFHIFLSSYEWLIPLGCILLTNEAVKKIIFAFSMFCWSTKMVVVIFLKGAECPSCSNWKLASNIEYIYLLFPNCTTLELYLQVEQLGHIMQSKNSYVWQLVVMEFSVLKYIKNTLVVGFLGTNSSEEWEII